MMLLSEGQMSDYKGARLIVNDLPLAKHLLADRGYDADWFRESRENKGIKPCIPPKKNRKIQIEYDSVTRSRTCSENSKTGAASQLVMTVAHTPSFQQYASPLL